MRGILAGYLIETRLMQLLWQLNYSSVLEQLLELDCLGWRFFVSDGPFYLPCDHVFPFFSRQDVAICKNLFPLSIAYDYLFQSNSRHFYPPQAILPSYLNSKFERGNINCVIMSSFDKSSLLRYFFFFVSLLFERGQPISFMWFSCNSNCCF